MISPSILPAAATSSGASVRARTAPRFSTSDTGRGSTCARQTVRQQQVVRRAQRRGRIGAPGCVHAGGVAEERRAPRLVERRPEGHPIAEPVADQRRVLGEPVRGVACRPAAPVLQFLRQIPVVQRDRGRDAGGQQGVDQPVVERQPGRVGRAAPAGLDPRPGHGQPVRVQAQLGHQPDVLGEAVVVVDGRLAGVPAVHLARGGREGVPDGRGPTVQCGGALDLVGGGGRTPHEVRREGQFRRAAQDLSFQRTLCDAVEISAPVGTSE